MPYAIEFAAWLVLEVVDNYYGLYVAAFAMTLGLQAARHYLSPQRYRIAWGVLSAIGLVWGGVALWEYIPRFIQWSDAYFFIPGVMLSVGLAKLQGHVRLNVYLSFLSLILAVVFAASVVMHPYRTVPYRIHKDNPWNRPPLTDNIRLWVTGHGWVGRDAGSNGLGGGMLGWISNNGPGIDWLIYRSFGIVVLVSALAVPPRMHIPSNKQIEGQTLGLAPIVSP
jgi:hypothetical protein